MITALFLAIALVGAVTCPLSLSQVTAFVNHTYEARIRRNGKVSTTQVRASDAGQAKKGDVQMRPPDPRVGAAPSLVMAGPLEGRRVGVRRIDESVDGEVPGQRMRPLVAEHLEGLRFPHVVIE